MVHVFMKHPFHFGGEVLIINDGIHLVVEKEGSDIKIGGAQSEASAIADNGFVMAECLLVIHKYPSSIFDQISQIRHGGVPDYGVIKLRREHDSNIHAGLDGCLQG
ncbi:hypothetical protein SDC9_191191 [bioreactor metagenome]|uniref:Uncharacterized protein n=1 Tax=bioreactor metagenome TaxID=1076179 RepID=A0A645HX63_9ZZZZ